MKNLASCVAEMSIRLSDFDHPSLKQARRDFHWDLANGEKVVRERLHLIADDELGQAMTECLAKFAEHTAPHLTDLPVSVIHNDANDGNVVLQPPEEGKVHSHRIQGLIDFGDAVHSWTIGDLAVAIAYAVLDQHDPLAIAGKMVSAYHAIRPISEVEFKVLFGLICLRLCMSATIAAEQSATHPDNEYLLISQGPIKRTLPRLALTSFPFAEAYFRNGCDREDGEGTTDPDTVSTVRKWLMEHQSQFAFPVNPVNRGQRPAPSQTLVLNLGVDSPLLPPNIDQLTEPELTNLVFGLMKQKTADVAIGRYLEPRVLYSSQHFVGSDPAEESRTVHLGIDIFAAAGTDVVAPLDGTAWYVGSINKPLDYGGLILLEHETGTGDKFLTLYGHLDPDSFGDLKVGDRVVKGQTIAKLGEPDCNGGWTPHVHFQLLLDDVGLGHEFPGVAYASQMAAWSTLSPDPNLILGIDGSCFPKRSPGKQQTLENRQRRIGPNLSLGYQDPIKMVRGWKQYLFDDMGRRYLDAYNNVPHVGHCHPKVVEAARQQMSLLNTNTRYLHDNINDLAEQLTATMPDGLDVCYFVNSASEANELALRLSRIYTGARDMLVLESAYHGHSTSLIDISPYKHSGPGGSGAPDWVHTVPSADTFRGRYRTPETAAVDYANEVADALQGIESANRKPCGFIFESCPSVGGQIIFPDGYLKLACDHVRQAGGLVIADDVQTGYGRLGSHMYGFEMQSIQPDIVILGKPIGNGHPLAAVITTRSIAETFNNGMEFFSTFGGNPVSAAVGLAVLEVLKSEKLQANAGIIGRHLLSGLGELQNEFPIMGDVRGRGFFLGVELVHRDPKQPEVLRPAAAEAKFISNECRRRAVLIGTDGPDHNVLKIRPPMCFSRENADQLLATLRNALALL